MCRTDPLLGAYAGSKWACETSFLTQRSSPLANVYGPKQRDWGAEPGCPCCMAEGRGGRGSRSVLTVMVPQTRDFIHVDDVACAILSSPASRMRVTATMDICTESKPPVIELADHFDAPASLHHANPVDSRLNAPGPGASGPHPWFQIGHRALRYTLLLITDWRDDYLTRTLTSRRW